MCLFFGFGLLIRALCLFSTYYPTDEPLIPALRRFAPAEPDERLVHAPAGAARKPAPRIPPGPQRQHCSCREFPFLLLQLRLRETPGATPDRYEQTVARVRPAARVPELREPMTGWARPGGPRPRLRDRPSGEVPAATSGCPGRRLLSHRIED